MIGRVWNILGLILKEKGGYFGGKNEVLSEEDAGFESLSRFWG